MSVDESRGARGGVYRYGEARIIDRTGRRRLPLGDDGFETACASSALVDKTMLVADVLDSGYKVTLFCRPRRFGKSLNMTMLKAFLETPPDGRSRAPLFEGTAIWEAGGGAYRTHQGAYPVVHLSFNSVKKLTWEDAYGALQGLLADEYGRHGYLEASAALSAADRAYFSRVASGSPDRPELERSLAALTRMLYRHHGARPVVLVDEYDAPVMAARSQGYYAEAVSFMKGLLTGALKDGGAALGFACLTGVQRISKESIFSDLNNLVVSTPLDARFDERYGFTGPEVSALAAHLGLSGCEREAAEWYDGYRFGNSDVYNPWSVVSYLERGCEPDVYWGNTSDNGALGELVRAADADTTAEILSLLEPGGSVWEPLDLSAVFPDGGLPGDAVWSMLYLAGYLTTDDTRSPNDPLALRRLRIPNREISVLYRREVVERFAAAAGGTGRLRRLHAALASGDREALEGTLREAALRASYHDLVGEGACHMLLLGLCFGMPGYLDPVSNREAGDGRADIQVAPDPDAGPAPGPHPLVTIEVKFGRGLDGPGLEELARRGLSQISERAYDEGSLPPGSDGRVRWGVAFSGKRVAAACEALPAR